MKILFIADSTSIHTKRWVEYFRDRHFNIYIITLGRKTEKIKDVNHLINFKQFYYGSIDFPIVLTKTRKIIHDLKPHILHAHFVHQYGWLAALSGFHPLVLTAWGTDILKLPHVSWSKIGRRLTQYALRKANFLTATSEYLKQEMIALGAEPTRIQVIFWGVDTHKFHPGVEVDDLRQTLSIEESQPVVVSNRNHIALYNNDIVIKAMAIVLKKIPNAVLVLQNAGGGLEEELKQLARSEGIMDSVRFLPQFNYNDMPAVYCLADIFVSVPSWDAGPVSLKEAMACGAVPIISDVEGPKEWVTDYTNGRVVPIRDIEQLAAAITELLIDVRTRHAISKSNTELIRKYAQHDLMMQKAEALYVQLTSKKKL